MFAFLSHTHYWYEVGMLKVPVCISSIVIPPISDVFGGTGPLPSGIALLFFRGISGKTFMCEYTLAREKVKSLEETLQITYHCQHSM